MRSVVVAAAVALLALCGATGVAASYASDLAAAQSTWFSKNMQNYQFDIIIGNGLSNAYATPDPYATLQVTNGKVVNAFTPQYHIPFNWTAADVTYDFDGGGAFNMYISVEAFFYEINQTIFTPATTQIIDLEFNQTTGMPTKIYVAIKLNKASPHFIGTGLNTNVFVGLQNLVNCGAKPCPQPPNLYTPTDAAQKATAALANWNQQYNNATNGFSNGYMFELQVLSNTDYGPFNSSAIGNNVIVTVSPDGSAITSVISAYTFAPISSTYWQNVILTVPQIITKINTYVTTPGNKYSVDVMYDPVFGTPLYILETNVGPVADTQTMYGINWLSPCSSQFKCNMTAAGWLGVGGLKNQLSNAMSSWTKTAQFVSATYNVDLYNSGAPDQNVTLTVTNGTVVAVVDAVSGNSIDSSQWFDYYPSIETMFGIIQAGITEFTNFQTMHLNIVYSAATGQPQQATFISIPWSVQTFVYSNLVGQTGLHTDPPKKGLTGGQKAGIAIGVIGGVALIGGLVGFLIYRQRQSARDSYTQI